jgi:Coenzyme PQQ synthesis protein D (PqqD)
MPRWPGYASFRRGPKARSVTADTILARDCELISTTVEQTVILLSVGAGSYFKLNQAGMEIWNLLQHPRRVREIIEVLAQSHEVDTEIVTRDVTVFLDKLVERRLLRVVDSPVVP